MDAPSLSSINRNHSNIQRADGTRLAALTSTCAAPSVSIFRNANNTLVNNSSFNTTINYNTTNGSSAGLSLDLIYKSAAPNAILNSGGRADEVRCHPGTRKEVIGLVEKSIQQKHSEPRVLWLSGPAGAGKSAIMQTVAERCEERGIPQANFFFFRADSSRRDASALVPTLVHQIIKLYPSIEHAVAPVLVSNPSLFQTGLRNQFGTLIHEVFPTIQDSLSICRPLVLLIDGLDECDSENKTEQRQLLQALDTLLIQKGPYFRVAIASRVEPQIAMAFKQLHSRVDSIFLDEQYSPEKDIRRFVIAEFEKIKSTHYLGDRLGRDWPSTSDVDGIVSKSSGQFIYAATVMRFIAHSPASPILSLKKVQGIVLPSKNTPFAHIDAVYTYILDQVDDLEAVKAIFAIRFLERNELIDLKIAMEAYLPRFSEEVFDSCISELSPLVGGRRRSLEFFHASFPDFLTDKTRAGDYHIDVEAFCTAAMPIWWLSKSGHKLYVFDICETALDRVREPTPMMTAALMQPHPILLGIANHSIWSPRNQIEAIVANLHRIYESHDPQSLIQIINMWTRDHECLKPYFAPYISQFDEFQEFNWRHELVYEW